MDSSPAVLLDIHYGGSSQGITTQSLWSNNEHTAHMQYYKTVYTDFLNL